jgi:hypothetical protein
MSAPHAAPPRIPDRYELKYTIADSLVEPIARWIQPYCEQDRYSRLAPDGFYTINSLFLDTRGARLLRMRLVDEPYRVTLRVRSYTEQPGFPYFLEVKRRWGDAIRKARATIGAAEWDVLVRGGLGALARALVSSGAEGARDFFDAAQTWDVRPWVMNQYRRMAFFSRIDEYARVTFDRDLRYAASPTYRMDPSHIGLAACGRFARLDPGAGCVLELKCDAGRVPLWMHELIRTFGLRRRGFSKFGCAMNAVIAQGRMDPLERTAVAKV